MFHLDNGSGVSTMPPIPPEQNLTPQWFTDGDGNNQGISWPGIHWFNTVQAELLNVLTVAGISPEKAKLTQVAEAIQKIIKNELPLASVTQRGIVQLSSLTNSTSKEHAANSFAVKSAYDLAAGKVDSVNGKKGAVTITASDIGSISQASADNRYLKLADSPDFIILYPGGTAEAPPSITLNQRIIIDNPFGISNIIPVIEIYYKDQWFTTYYSAHNSGGTYWHYGVGCAQVNNQIIAVGAPHAIYYHGFLPNFLGLTAPETVTTAPYRIKVWKIK